MTCSTSHTSPTGVRARSVCLRMYVHMCRCVYRLYVHPGGVSESQPGWFVVEMQVGTPWQGPERAEGLTPEED